MMCCAAAPNELKSLSADSVALAQNQHRIKTFQFVGSP